MTGEPTAPNTWIRKSRPIIHRKSNRMDLRVGMITEEVSSTCFIWGLGPLDLLLTRLSNPTERVWRIMVGCSVIEARRRENPFSSHSRSIKHACHNMLLSFYFSRSPHRLVQTRGTIASLHLDVHQIINFDRKGIAIEFLFSSCLGVDGSNESYSAERSSGHFLRQSKQPTEPTMVDYCVNFAQENIFNVISAASDIVKVSSMLGTPSNWTLSHWGAQAVQSSVMDEFATQYCRVKTIL